MKSQPGTQAWYAISAVLFSLPLFFFFSNFKQTPIVDMILNNRVMAMIEITRSTKVGPYTNFQYKFFCGLKTYIFLIK